MYYKKPQPKFIHEYHETRALGLDGSVNGEGILAAARVLAQDNLLFPQGEDESKFRSKTSKGIEAGLQHARNFEALKDAGIVSTGEEMPGNHRFRNAAGASALNAG